MKWFGVMKAGSKQKTIQRVKPTPPKLLRKPKVEQGTKPMRRVEEEVAEDNVFQLLPEGCMCNGDVCKRKAKHGCILCSARLCDYHHAKIATGRKKKATGRAADTIHHFKHGTCKDGQWVNSDGTPWRHTQLVGDKK